MTEWVCHYALAEKLDIIFLVPEYLDITGYKW